jgi:very-short-patch-repair endonuclease
MKRITNSAKKLMRSLNKFHVFFKSEFWDKHKHIDIRIPKGKIDVEIDGEQHVTRPKQIISDLNRSHYSDHDGYATMHVPNNLVEIESDKIAKAIAEASEIRKEEIK